MTDHIFLGFHHFALRCPDLQKSIAFYEALGFHQVHHWQLPQYSIEHAVMMQAPDSKSWIELFDLDAEIPMQGSAASGRASVSTGALTHICLAVSELDLAVDCAVEAGARKNLVRKLSIWARRL